jgi:aspartate racemase
MLQDSEAEAVLLDENTEGKFPLRCQGLLSTTLKGSVKTILPEVSPDDTAYMIYTSGSTGQPKGVQITHSSLVHYADVAGSNYGFRSKDRVLQFSSICFDASVEEIFCTLYHGATLVLRTEAMLGSVSEFVRQVEAQKITVLSLPTAYWHEVALGLDQLDFRFSPTLRLVIFGGERALPVRLRTWRARTGPETLLVNAYGPTEATVGATAYLVPFSFDTNNRTEVPIGAPLPGYTCYVLDPFMNPVPVGMPGELYIGGPGLARGYKGRPDLTRDRFPGNPFSFDTADRLYKTGDVVRFLDEGILEFAGRSDHQVKLRGYRIELGEIEATINRFPGVEQSLVEVREDDSGQKRLIAYLECKEQPNSLKDLKKFLNQKLPAFMVPSAYLFLEQFPKTPGGKLDRKALPTPASWAGSVAEENKPKSPLELQLQLLFEKHLGQRGVGTDVSFFDLGGDSLTALRLILDLEKLVQQKLPLGILYEASTIRSLAERLEEHRPDGESVLVPLQPHGSRPPLFLIHTTPGDVLGYGNLIYHLSEDQPCYGFQSLGMIQPEKAHTSIEEMAQRYVEELLQFQPEGPYYLGGWCYGGIVAVEMAHQLRQRGKEVALLALIEAPAPPAKRGRLKQIVRRVQSFSRLPVMETVRYLRGKYEYYSGIADENRKRFQRAEPKEEAGAVVDATIVERNSYLQKLEWLYEKNLTALNAYKVDPYQGKLVLFNATTRDSAQLPDPDYGWGGLAEEIEVHSIPGDHESILLEPNVQLLAEKLQQVLNQAVDRPLEQLLTT